MKINKNCCQDFELNYYLKIVENFQDHETNREKRVIFMNHSLLKLMKILKRTEKKEMIANAIILILSLFEDIPPDNYNNLGMSIDEIHDEDKYNFMEQLKQEFLLN